MAFAAAAQTSFVAALAVLVLAFGLSFLAAFAAAARSAADRLNVSFFPASPASLVLELAVLLRVPGSSATQTISVRHRVDHADVHWIRCPRMRVHRLHVGVDRFRQLCPRLWAP